MEHFGEDRMIDMDSSESWTIDELIEVTKVAFQANKQCHAILDLESLMGYQFGNLPHEPHEPHNTGDKEVCSSDKDTVELFCTEDVTSIYYPSRYDVDSVQVTYTDMKCLDPAEWLSSPIMNFYIRHLQQQLPEDGKCMYHLFHTYFYDKLQKMDYSDSSFSRFRNWWKDINIIEIPYILIPVIENAHWSLVIVSVPTNTILHLDSMGYKSNSICNNIKRFIKEEWSYQELGDKFGHPFKDEVTYTELEVPKQTNTSDCGLFVLHYMERFIAKSLERPRLRDLTMVSKEWFCPQQAANLRGEIRNLLFHEFKK